MTSKRFFLNSSIIESVDHKVVLVLDRSPKFASPAPSADIALSIRDEQNIQISGQFKKILWNCSVEAVTEFHRVVFDLFPGGKKQLRFITSDYVGKHLTDSWGERLLTREEILKLLKNCELPKPDGDASSCSILNGIILALEAISEWTPQQRQSLHKLRAYCDQKEKECPEQCRKPRNVADLVKQTDDDQNTADECIAPTTIASMSGSSQATFPQRVESRCSQEEGEIHESKPQEAGNQDSANSKSMKEEQCIPEEKLQVKKYSANFHIKNKGTIVVITSIESLSEFENINEWVAEQIEARNKSASGKMKRIDHINLFIFNIAKSTDAPNAAFAGLKQRRRFNSHLISVVAGQNLIPSVHKILQEIYELVSTTVVGIPMKEETASQSQKLDAVDYDVEMLHPRTAHSTIKAFGLLDSKTSKMLDNTLHGNLFSSVRLKWCTITSKLKSDMSPLLQESYPITLAYAHNRASVCLSSFIVQQSKNVMLEVLPDAYREIQPSLGPNFKDKLISHYLSKDTAGNMIIHCVAIGEKALFGGKLSSERIYGTKGCSSQLVTNLNLKAMHQLLNATQIQPIPFAKMMRTDMIGIEDNAGKDYSDLFTRNAQLLNEMPFRLKNSFIFNVPEKFEPLLSLVHNPKMDASQYEECRTQIHKLVTARDNVNDPALTERTFDCELLSFGSTAMASKDKQFRIAFDELSRVLQRVSVLSSNHRRLYEMFIEAADIRPSPQVSSASTRKKTLEEKFDEEQRMQQRIKRRKKQVTNYWKPNEEVNLYDWWHSHYEKEYWSGWKGDFDGRIKYGDKAQDSLYPNLKLPPGQSKSAGTGTAGPIE